MKEYKFIKNINDIYFIISQKTYEGNIYYGIGAWWNKKEKIWFPVVSYQYYNTPEAVEAKFKKERDIK